MGQAAGEREIEVFLGGFPAEMTAIAEQLRRLVKQAVPEAIERLRPGWRLIGYDVTLGRRRRYFAYVAPEEGHVHLGFEFGAWLDDSQGLLEGSHLKLRQVRYLTFRSGMRLPRAAVIKLLREAARLALLSPAERLALAFEKEIAPPG